MPFFCALVARERTLRGPWALAEDNWTSQPMRPVGAFDQGVGLDPAASYPGADFAVAAEAAFLCGAQDALVVGLVLVTDGDDVAVFVLAPLMDGFAAAVGPQPQVHRGFHAGVLAHFPAQQVPLTDWHVAVGVHLVHAVDHVPQIRMLFMAEVIGIQRHRNKGRREPAAGRRHGHRGHLVQYPVVDGLSGASGLPQHF